MVGNKKEPFVFQIKRVGKKKKVFKNFKRFIFCKNLNINYPEYSGLKLIQLWLHQKQGYPESYPNLMIT